MLVQRLTILMTYQDNFFIFVFFWFFLILNKVIVLDECVDGFGKYLRSKNMDCRIISVRKYFMAFQDSDKKYKGVSDSLISDMCMDIGKLECRVLLVTADKKFYKEHPGLKVYHKNVSGNGYDRTYFNVLKFFKLG